MKIIVFVLLSITASMFLGSCSNAFTPATNTPTSTSTTTFTPEPTGTPTMTPFPPPMQGKGSISVQISCLIAVSPQGQYLYSLMGSGHTISLIVVYQGQKYSFVAKAVTDTESRVFFNNVDPGVYNLTFGDASSVLAIPGSTVSSMGVVENESRDLGKVVIPISDVDCSSLSH
jgi:hypothetical protein